MVFQGQEIPHPHPVPPLEIDDIIRDKRLIKHLWIEFILNPERIEAFARSKDEPIELLLIWGLAFDFLGFTRYMTRGWE